MFINEFWILIGEFYKYLKTFMAKVMIEVHYEGTDFWSYIGKVYKHF